MMNLHIPQTGMSLSFHAIIHDAWAVKMAGFGPLTPQEEDNER